MPSVTIDAGVLATPPGNGSTDEVQSYVETLLDWSQLLDEPWVDIFMSEHVFETLSADDLFPSRDQLKRLFKATGIEEFDVNTVAVVVDRLLRSTLSFETYFHIQNVQTEELTTEPDILRLCSSTRLQSDLARCVVLIAILRRHCQEPVSDHSLILRRAPDRVIRVRSLIKMLEHDRTDLDGLPTPPEYFDGDVLICDDFRGLIGGLDEATILLKATDTLGVETAVHIAVYKARLARGTEPHWDDVPRFRVGNRFLESFQSHHPSRPLSANLLQSVVDALEYTNMARTHALRTGVGGGNPQIVRQGDQAKAWRRDIDSEHHLHYWVCEDRIVELASMSFPHDDYTIPN